jgi:multidrug resistance efflux pump
MEMARVNRTTGFFLVVGIIALLGTVTGISVMQNGGAPADVTPGRAGGDTIAASGSFDVDSGLSNLVPRGLPGRVKAVLVKETDAVKAGQPLVQLDDQRVRDQLQIAEQAVKVGRARLHDAKIAADQKVREYDLEVSRAEAAVENAKAAYTLAYDTWQSAKKLREINAGGDVAESRAETAARHANRNVELATDFLKKLKAIDPKVSLTEHEEALKEAELKVNAAKEELESFVIRAPSDGEILRINYQIGGSAPLTPSDPNASQALIFCPKEDQVVRAEIDQEWALEVKPGQKATVTFQAANRELSWTGRVERVANYMTRRRSRALDSASFSDGITRECVIRINPDANNPIVHNMKVQVKIHLDK